MERHPANAGPRFLFTLALRPDAPMGAARFWKSQQPDQAISPVGWKHFIGGAWVEIAGPTDVRRWSGRASGVREFEGRLCGEREGIQLPLADAQQDFAAEILDENPQQRMPVFVEGPQPDFPDFGNPLHVADHVSPGADHCGAELDGCIRRHDQQSIAPGDWYAQRDLAIGTHGDGAIFSFDDSHSISPSSGPENSPGVAEAGQQGTLPPFRDAGLTGGGAK